MTIEIPLNSKKYPGLVALVDDEDYPLVSGYGWSPAKSKKTFYARTYRVNAQGNKSSVDMHRLILPDVPQIDHANLNGLDNQRANLRPARGGQNNANRAKQDGCTSQYKGVSWVSSRSRWLVQVAKDGTSHHVGLFDDEIAAAIAYDRAAVELFGEFARLNFPA